MNIWISPTFLEERQVKKDERALLAARIAYKVRCFLV